VNLLVFLRYVVLKDSKQPKHASHVNIP